MLFNGGVSANDAAADAHHMLNVSKAHDHAIPYLGVPFDEAGVSDVRVLHRHSLFHLAVPAYGDIAYELDLSRVQEGLYLFQSAGMNPLVGLIVVLAVEVADGSR